MSAPATAPRLEQPCFLVICRDGSDSAVPRGEFLKEHLDHVEAHWQRYVTAGPIREPGAEKLVGSVFLVLADSLEDAKALMEGDPYLTCGMYETVEYKEFTNSVGRFIGGKIWESAEAVANVAAGGPTKLTTGV
jgi:uncharacterized protein